MRVSQLLLMLGITAFLTYPASSSTEWALVPNADGILQLVNITALTIAASLLGNTVAKFLLYTPANPSDNQEIIPNDAVSLHNSNFNFNCPTRFVIHGWIGNEDSRINSILREAYFKLGCFNIIYVDWSSASRRDYVYARIQVKEVGFQVGTFMDFLNHEGVSYESIYCVGHSLGAHVCGYAGKNTKFGRIHTIFGLDTALPLFDINKPAERLADGDAYYIQTIHTDSGRNGFLSPIGNSSFYPNWGSQQPACITQSLGYCSHILAINYFAETLNTTNRCESTLCGDLTNIRTHTCMNTNVFALMGGEPSNTLITGIFYLAVNRQSPYGTG